MCMIINMSYSPTNGLIKCLCTKVFIVGFGVMKLHHFLDLGRTQIRIGQPQYNQCSSIPITKVDSFRQLPSHDTDQHCLPPIINDCFILGKCLTKTIVVDYLAPQVEMLPHHRHHFVVLHKHHNTAVLLCQPYHLLHSLIHHFHHQCLVFRQGLEGEFYLFVIILRNTVNWKLTPLYYMLEFVHLVRNIHQQRTEIIYRLHCTPRHYRQLTHCNDVSKSTTLETKQLNLALSHAFTLDQYCTLLTATVSRYLHQEIYYVVYPSNTQLFSGQTTVYVVSLHILPYLPHTHFTQPHRQQPLDYLYSYVRLRSVYTAHLSDVVLCCLNQCSQYTQPLLQQVFIPYFVEVLIEALTQSNNLQVGDLR